MKLRRLIIREIRHRKLNFLLSVLGVVLAVVCVVGTVGLLRAHDAHAEEVIAEMEEATKAEMVKLEDDIRKSMKGLGFNIYIFPKDQEMSEVYAEGFASKTMPESYVTTLAESKIVTVNHLLPSLTQKLTWPEEERTVIVIGVRGEVPLAHRDPKAPLLDPVEPGKVVMGYELHRGVGVEEGDPVTFMGREFEVTTCYGERGSKDDITLWMNLGEVQDLFGKAGQINAIQALECNCATVDRLGEIRAELLALLPDTQIIETESTALARAEARNSAQAVAANQIAAKEAETVQLRRERERFASILLPLVSLMCMGWIGMLTVMNVRERVNEIGVLRALGVSSGKVLGAFLGRALLAGVVGAVLGSGVALGLAGGVKDSVFYGYSLGALVGVKGLVWPLVLAPVLAGLGAWLPSFQAAQQDPAVVLRQD
jgi:putative ABC transport system permease protein